MWSPSWTASYVVSCDLIWCVRSINYKLLSSGTGFIAVYIIFFNCNILPQKCPLQIALALLFKNYFNIIIQSFRASLQTLRLNLYMKIFSLTLCRRATWCITIKCTGKPRVSFSRLWDDTRVFVINVIPTKLHGVISKKNFVFLSTATGTPWVSQKLGSETSYCYSFMWTRE